MRDEIQRSCRVCGAPVAVTGRGRPPLYCSRSCQARAYRRRRSAAGPVAAPAAGGTDDRSAKRRRVAEAVWRIAAEHGLEAATMRRIAGTAGMSLRMVQYQYASKHDLLLDALRRLHAENERHARRRIPAGTTDPRSLLTAVLHEFLPLDDQRAFSLRVLNAYYARSLTDSALAAVFLPDQHPLEDLVASLLEAARDAGHAAPGMDPAHEADLLVAGATGLGTDVLHGRRRLADARAVLEYHLTRLLG
ncbi:TetR family transcriptional regulator C-terminal domain-containing protein [Streptomyces sp. MJP52]|uniref:TetR/AcrR family transcriptional regulator n=1 Tax=Streptomyces sp. MJP52 TaxID=2940555 RepID=UPI0024761693|nr:TetR family transcriptional regulator C-terminal domain-containing protein [Streptomyces sp. MJP52]MDH6228637.1 AcrR family transcriptional regulator [Streptomyces sp. MJP52]